MLDGELQAWVASLSPAPVRVNHAVVDVIVPVYGNLDLVLRCLRSVLTSSNQIPYELLVIDDASPSDPSLPVLHQLAELGHIELLVNRQNLGFPATCNRGFAVHPDRDVVILNSDTEVYGDWLDRMRAAAYSDAAIGTVTPLTGDGEIASYPRFCFPNARTLELSPDALDTMAARVNAGALIDVPTGVGFCMYIKRDCLAQTGGFDAELFGKGYGEENDLCRRLAELGWRNVITADTYVLHRGGGSFGPSKLARIRAALGVLEDRHPGYGALVADFIALDPLRPFRQALDLARLEQRCGHPRFLMITHNWGGGVERHVQEMKGLLESEGAHVFICRPDETDSGQVLLEVPGGLEMPNLPVPRLSLSPRRFADALNVLGIDHVHVHNLAGYEAWMSRYVAEALASAQIPYDVTLHDFQSFCPQNHLVDFSDFYCGEPSEESCTNCVETLGSPYGRPVIWQWRENSALLFAGARFVFAPSHDTARRVSRHFPQLDPVVVSHPDLPATQAGHRSPLPKVSVRRPGSKRIGLLGAVSTPKGSGVLRDVARLSAEKRTPLHFVVIGTTDIDDVLADAPNVEITGRYEDGALESLMSAADLDVIWFPAVWPETYSYTLSAALRTGLEIVAFELGAVAERLGDLGRGILLPMEAMLDPATVLECLLSQTSDSAGRPVIDAPQPVRPYSIIGDYYRRPEWVSQS